MHFVTIGPYSLNLDAIRYVRWLEPGEGQPHLEAEVYFIASSDVLRLTGRDAEALHQVVRR